MLLAESLERIDAVDAGGGVLLRLHGRGPGPGRTPAQVVLVRDGRRSTLDALPDGGPPPAPGTWRLAFALPARRAGDALLLSHGAEAVALPLEPPVPPAVAARLDTLESELAASRHRRELGERERAALQAELFAVREQLARVQDELEDADARLAERTGRARAAAARVAELEDALDELDRERRHLQRLAERRERPDQQPTGELAAVTPPAAAARPVPAGRPRTALRVAALGGTLVVATVAAVLLPGSERRARDGSAAAAAERRPTPARTSGQVYGALYKRAAARYRLDWRVLAAVGELESGHGTSPLPGVRHGTNAAGAAGPMQFTAASWRAYGMDADGDGRADPYDPADAIPAAAAFLRSHGAPADWRRALSAYNRQPGYADAVLSRARARAAARRAG